MNKFGIVLGAAAIATLAGCKDPDYKYDSSKAQNEVKNVDTTPAVQPEVKKCPCPPGTKHTSPCTCGAPDCKCVVEQKPITVTEIKPTPAPAPAPASVVPAAPEYTVYVVQSGDYLAKISKKFNVTIDSIKRLNPSIKKDVVWVGQKLKIPGKVEVPAAAAAPAAAAVVKTSAKKSFTPYNGATKEYVVKGGDTLGAIAYGNGISIRQLKELNGLDKDGLRVGQKLRIPAEKVTKASAEKPAKAAKSAKAAEPKKAVAETKKAAEPAATAKAKTAAEPAKVAEPAAPAAETVAPAAAPAESAAPAAGEQPAAAPAAEAKPAAPAAATTTYVVQEGDDMTGVSIRWGVSAAEIRELNNLADGDQLVPGQIIKLPAEAQQ